jgi:hypothetical protein
VKPLADAYRCQAQDTSREIEQFLVERWRTMTPQDKLAQIDDACCGGDELARMGIRLRHPDADEREVRLRVAALRLERALMIDAFGWDPAAHGG